MHPTTQPVLPMIARLASFTPRRMLTSHLNLRNAIILSMLCVPPLLLTAAIHLPTLIFNSPDQNAYFYFARGLSQDLSSSAAFGLAAVCLLVAVALPAPRGAAASGTVR